MLFAIGKPIMDIVVKVDESFLKKYQLSPNCSIQASKEQANLFDEVLELNPKYIAGGSVTNTTRIFQWISQYTQNVFYLGIIGQDNYGKQIKEQLKTDKIDYFFYETQSIETTQCAVLANDNGTNRCLVSKSLLLTLNVNNINQHLNFDDNLNEKIRHCKVLYLPVYSLGLFPHNIREIIEKFVQLNKKIVMNLGANYVLEKYADNAIYLFQFANVVIGNEEEYHTLAKILNLNYSPNYLEQLLKDLTQLNELKNQNRILIVTRGSDRILSFENDQITYYNVEKISNIKDTTGAGDAFAGGFLAQFVQYRPLDQCIDCGVFCAAEVIQHYGCDFDKKKCYNV